MILPLATSFELWGFVGTRVATAHTDDLWAVVGSNAPKTPPAKPAAAEEDPMAVRPTKSAA